MENNSSVHTQYSLQDTRLLLVVSNFGHLARVLIPAMVSELETAFGVSIQDDKQVCSLGYSHVMPIHPPADVDDSRQRAGQDPVRELREAKSGRFNRDCTRWYSGCFHGLVRDTTAERSVQHHMHPQLLNDE